MNKSGAKENGWQPLRFNSSGSKVDQEKKILRGYVVAQAGPFKSAGRGQFDAQSLSSIVILMNANPKGLRSRFGHPTMCDDGLGSFLGMAKDARLDGDKVRADLHLDKTSFNTPRGNIGQYVLDRAESNPDTISSSLVLMADREQLLDDAGRPKLDDAGNEIPPVWRPTALRASDVVETGDAVDGLLSAGADLATMPGGLWHLAAHQFDTLFAGRDRAYVEATCAEWIGRYLDQRDERDGPRPPDHAAALALRLRLLEFSA